MQKLHSAEKFYTDCNCVHEIIPFLHLFHLALDHPLARSPLSSPRTEKPTENNQATQRQTTTEEWVIGWVMFAYRFSVGSGKSTCSLTNNAHRWAT